MNRLFIRTLTILSSQKCNKLKKKIKEIRYQDTKVSHRLNLKRVTQSANLQQTEQQLNKYQMSCRTYSSQLIFQSLLIKTLLEWSCSLSLKLSTKNLKYSKTCYSKISNNTLYQSTSYQISTLYKNSISCRLRNTFIYLTNNTKLSKNYLYRTEYWLVNHHLWQKLYPVKDFL